MLPPVPLTRCLCRSSACTPYSSAQRFPPPDPSAACFSTCPLLLLPACLQTLPEKEAKTVVAQILAGLVYLNTKPRSIIHYDLKPANILFDCNGECKITVSAAAGGGAKRHCCR